MAGIVFPKGAMRGVYQAGVVHALTISGFFPETLLGSSVGGLSAAALALASERASQRERMALVGEYLDAWRRNPGADALEKMRRGPPSILLGDLCDVDLPLGALATHLGRILDPRAGKLAKLGSALRLGWGLPLRRPRVLRALACAAGAALRGIFAGDPGVRAAQAALGAYGMGRSVFGFSAVDEWFGVLGRYAPGGPSTRLGELTRSDLLVPAANLSRMEGGDGLRAILTFEKPLSSGDPGPRLLDALRASAAFGPFFGAVRLREVVERTPPGARPDDVLMDAAVVEADALAPIISRWTERGADGEHRLLTVYNSPFGPDSGAGLPRSPFFGSALRSLELWDELDLPFSAQVVEQVTEMVEAIRSEGDEIPSRSDGRPYLPVYSFPVAPRTTLPVGVLCAPEDGELMDAAAMGCRAGLEAVHAETIRALGGDAPVPCKRVLEAARASRGPVIAAGDDADAYFRPLPVICEGCPGMLQAPALRPAEAGPSAGRGGFNDFAELHEQNRAEPGREPRPLTIVVPAGGVFLGVFQFGAIAALKQYGVAPDLYASASVGTIFSYLLESRLGPEADLETVVKLARTVPEWVDAVVGEDGERAPGLPGVVDAITDAVVGRWRGPQAEALRRLRPRQVFDALAAEELDAGRQPVWETLRSGLDAVLFQPIADRRTGARRTLDRGFGLASGDRGELREVVGNLVRGRLRAALESPGEERPPLLDRLAANLDLYDPGPPVREGYVLGFASLEHQLRRIAFDGVTGPGPTMPRYSEEKRVRFVFTVTNHTLGRLEYFGFDDGRSLVSPPPLAIQAALAASSFPLAFRRRTRAEITGEAGEEGGALYADGGILDNFPSDAAFAYLHRLTDLDDTRWIGAVPHHILLLSLTSPPALPGGSPEDDGILFTTLRAQWLGEAEKVARTLGMQGHINALAARANPILRRRGRRQAIVAEMSLVAPTYTIYPSAFAFKDWLGFDEGKQLEMLASGCRRARMALEWGAYQDREQEKPPAARRALPVLRRDFSDALRAEVSRRRDPRSRACVFGDLGPGGAPATCPFTDHGATAAVFERCKATVDRELAPRDLKLWRRLHPPRRT